MNPEISCNQECFEGLRRFKLKSPKITVFPGHPIKAFSKSGKKTGVFFLLDYMQP